MTVLYGWELAEEERDRLLDSASWEAFHRAEEKCAAAEERRLAAWREFQARRGYHQTAMLEFERLIAEADRLQTEADPAPPLPTLDRP